MFKIESIKYRCLKCHFFTAGIPNGTGKEDVSRFCPVCNSELVRCPRCLLYASTTRRDGKLLCDVCELHLPQKNFSESRQRPGWGFDWC